MIVILSVPSNDCRGYWLVVNPFSLYLNKDSLIFLFSCTSSCNWTYRSFHGLLVDCKGCSFPLRHSLVSLSCWNSTHSTCCNATITHSEWSERVKWILDTKLSIFSLHEWFIDQFTDSWKWAHLCDNSKSGEWIQLPSCSFWKCLIFHWKDFKLKLLDSERHSRP